MRRSRRRGRFIAPTADVSAPVGCRSILLIPIIYGGHHRYEVKTLLHQNNCNNCNICNKCNNPLFPSNCFVDASCQEGLSQQSLSYTLSLRYDWGRIGASTTP
jgi:hypothetical protein